MIIQCAENLAAHELEDLRGRVAGFGLKVTEVVTQAGRYLIALGGRQRRASRVGRLQIGVAQMEGRTHAD
jgi:hypothetical protein